MREVSVRFRDTKSISKLRNLAYKHEVPMTKLVIKAIENYGKENTNYYKCKMLENKIAELQSLSDKYKDLYELSLNQPKPFNNGRDVTPLIEQLSTLCNGSFTITINEHKDKYNTHSLRYESPYEFYMEPSDDCSHSYSCVPIDIDIIDKMGYIDTSLKLEGYHNAIPFTVLHFNLYDLLESAINLINNKQNINQ